MAVSSFTYAPRDPANSVLYQIVQRHYETFRAQAASLRDGEGLPRFVDQEFRDFLRCGWHAGGFARLRCGTCGLDRLVASSVLLADSAAGSPYSISVLSVAQPDPALLSPLRVIQ